MSKLLIATITWAVLLGVLFVVQAPLLDALWMLYLPIHWFFPVGGGVLGIIGIWLLIRKRDWRALVPVVWCAVGLTLFFTSGFRHGRRILFEIRQDHFEEMLAEAKRTGTGPATEGDLDPGPPERWAFMWQRGVTDNWVGVVYDPTGDVMQVNRADGWDELRDPALSKIVMLFGGTLHRTEHMEGDWYLCWFT